MSICADQGTDPLYLGTLSLLGVPAPGTQQLFVGERGSHYNTHDASCETVSGV